MSKFKLYKQLDSVDCGPSCIRMIANYYGKNVPINFLRDKSRFSKIGVSLNGISEAAESIGFKTLAVRLTTERLVNEAPLPCILHWQQKHFVVLYNVKKKSFQWRKEGTIIEVADPAVGKISYTISEFEDMWLQHDGLGVAMLFEPNSNFNEINNYEAKDDSGDEYGFSRILRYLFGGSKKIIFQLILGLLLGSFLQLLFPFLTQAIVDVGIKENSLSLLSLILIGQFVLIISRVTAEYIRSWLLLHLSIKVNLNILSDFFFKLTKLPLSFFDTKIFGDLMQRIGDHHRIQSFLTGQLLTFISSVVSLIIFSLVLLIYDGLIFFIFITGFVAYLLWVAIFLKRRKVLDYKIFDVSAKSQNAILHLIYGMQEIKLTNSERTRRWNWERLQANQFRLQMSSLELSQYQSAGGTLINESKNILITFFAAQSVISYDMTLGSMLAITYILGQLKGPTESLISFVREYQDAKISLQRMEDIHKLKDEDNSGSYRLSKESPFQKIEIKNLSFRYPGPDSDIQVLKGLNLEIHAGETIAIVGTSGSGKTTLLKLIMKFYENYDGDIFIDGVDIKNINTSRWRESLGTVLQDGYIFSDSIAMNIAIDEEQIDIEKLNKAILLANLEDFVSSLPLGIETQIGAEGMGVSEGQKQRILIARAIYRDPALLIFDEATNSLDAKNESVIVRNLEKFFHKRTVLIVAHRLSTVRNADKIIVLNNGVITEVGTHAELSEQDGSYYELIKNQLELGK
jgi:ATP-binding cassette subfamily B protein